jgi:hypothetical protein
LFEFTLFVEEETNTDAQLPTTLPDIYFLVGIFPIFFKKAKAAKASSQARVTEYYFFY